MTDINTLRTYDGPDKVISSSDMRRELASSKKNSVKFLAGLESLDNLIDGFEGGELIAISGPTANGKTLFAQTLTMNFVKQGIMSIWFTFEVPPRQFLDQLPAECEIFMPKLLVPNKPSWIDDRIVESKLKYNTRAVFIDHLHFLIDLAKGGINVSIDIGMVVRGLKRQAVRHNIVIFLLCHATKGQRPDGTLRDLGAMDIRDSSMVGQESDVVIMLQRRKDSDTDEYNNRANVKVCKHRRTGVMEKKIILEKKGLLFHDPFAVPKDSQVKMAEIQDGGDGDDSVPF